MRTILFALLASALCCNADSFYDQASWMAAAQQSSPGSQWITIPTDVLLAYPIASIDFNYQGVNQYDQQEYLNSGSLPLAAGLSYEGGQEEILTEKIFFSSPVYAIGGILDESADTSPITTGLIIDGQAAPDYTHVTQTENGIEFNAFWGATFPGTSEIDVLPGGFTSDQYMSNSQIGTLSDIQLLVGVNSPMFRLARLNRIIATPEPSSLSIMLVGFGVFLWALLGKK